MAWHPSSVLRFAAEDDDLFQDEIDGINAAELAAEGNSGQALVGFTPVPVPFNSSRNAAQLIPRIPIRMSPSLQDASGKGNGPSAFLFAGQSGAKGGKFANTPSQQPSQPSDDSGLTATEKMDPRLARASEIVQLVLNGLIQSGGIFKGENGVYQINFSPRQITAAESFAGELFLNVTTNKVSFKDNGGSVRPLE